ncbi:lytic transglycosylase, partial [Nocardia sp. CDC186]|nr:lytic transglycosylase [Nocardia beijingensis]MEB3513836.1 lytic transglycosylase [Nocardia sp. CDC186]
SMAYAANVLSWARAYRTGGSPTPVRVSPDLVAPGSLPPVGPGTDMTAVTATVPAPEVATPPPSPRPQTQTQTQVMITLPGLPPIPCGIFCPPPQPVHPCLVQPIPAPMPQPGQPESGRIPLAPGQTYGAAPGHLRNPDVDGADAEPRSADAGTVDCAQPEAATAPVPAPDAPQRDVAPRHPEPATTTPPAPEPEPEPERGVEPAPPPPPAITLPFGIVIPLPGPPPPPPAG